MRREVSSRDDVIAPSDLQKAVDTLQEERDALQTAVDDAEKQLSFAKLSEEETEEAEEAVRDAKESLQEWEANEGEQQKEMKGIVKEVGEEQMINDSYFVEYCEELVKDIGDMPKKIPGYIVIDWDATADNLKTDYNSVDFEGVTFWYSNC